MSLAYSGPDSGTNLPVVLHASAGQFFVRQGIFTPDNATLAGGILGSSSTLRQLARIPSPAVTGRAGFDPAGEVT